MLRYRFRTAPSGGMSVGAVLNKLAETAEHVGEFAREFGEQNWGDMDEDETAGWRKVLADLEAAAAAFRRTVDLTAVGRETLSPDGQAPRQRPCPVSVRRPSRRR
ncbi:hypothetical protein GCM10022419_133630 [Nonomuraea rosea]|uniref:WXG100 family type VII secretion target n=1 Tax=Nonomuraea rosea TaxID=638574 RepID=A0ABP7A5Q3_9ACTN